MAKYIVIENQEAKGPLIPDNLHHAQIEVYGPFDTVSEAKQFIMDDAQNCWDNFDTSRFEQPETFASRSIICEVTEAFVPIPHVNVEWELKRLKKKRRRKKKQ